jgi:hypothetical protein
MFGSQRQKQIPHHVLFASPCAADSWQASSSVLRQSAREGETEKGRQIGRRDAPAFDEHY